MAEYLLTFAGYSVLFLLAAVPLFLACRNREDRRETANRFALSGLILAALSAVVDISSERFVAQCFDAGYRNCLDPGRAGMQLMMLFLYALVAWLTANVIRDQ